MIKYLKEYRFYIILFLFLLIPILAIDTSTRSPSQYRVYDKVMVAVTSPIQTLISWVLDSTIDAWHNYIYLWNTRQMNTDLLEENRKLLNTIVNLKETEEENLRLRNLLQFNETFELKSIVARVIARDVSTEFKALRINRGSNAGIEKNMAVLNQDGVIGRVWRVTPTTADIVTILDLYSAVDSYVKRSRARGVVEGLNDDFCQLKYALRTDDIKPDDLLLTSGLGGIFPKGIPVGTVREVSKASFGITQTVIVEPSVDFTKLEEVLVITQFNSAPMHVGDDATQVMPKVPGQTPKPAGTPTANVPKPNSGETL